MAVHPNPLSLRYVTGVVETRPDHKAWRSQYMGLSLLPARDVPGYKLTWDVVQSENNLAGIYAINGRPVPGSEMLFAQKFAEMLNVMSARVLHPDDVSILREPGELAVSRTGKGLVEAAQRNLNKKIADIDNEVDAQVEYMIMHALQGQIVWPPVDAGGNAIATPMPQWGNTQITINFPLRTSFVQDVTTLVGYQSRTGGAMAWDDAGSTPLVDLEVVAQLINKTTGLRGHNATIIMNDEILSYLCFNTSILAWIQGTEKGTNYIAPADLQGLIQTKIGYKIKLYDAAWTYRTNLDSSEGPTVNSVPFLGRGKLLIIPDGADLGYWADGPSPDGRYQSGKYNWLVKEDEPPWETRVGEGRVGFPIPEHFDSIFVLDVFS